MKPLLALVVTILVLTTHAHPENIEEVKELPQTKEPVVEAEETEPQARIERCTTCQGPKLNLKSHKDVLAALTQFPAGAEVHTQQSFEGCSSDKGCAGIKVKDGQVLERFGNLDSFRAAAAQDTGNEFSFHAAGTFGNNLLEGANGEVPFWWMNQNSPFKSTGGAGAGNFEKFSKSSSSSFSTTGNGANFDIGANPFLNGEFSKIAGGFTSGGAAANFGASAEAKPSTYQSSSFESSSFSTSNKDGAQVPAFQAGFGANGNSQFAGQSSNSVSQFSNSNSANANQFGAGFGATGQFGAGQNFNQFGANANKFSASGSGYTGSSPSPFTASTAGSNINLIQNSQKTSEFDFEQQQQTQQNIDEAFRHTGNVNAHEHTGGDLQQTCAGQGYVCVHKAQCNNGVVNMNGAGVLAANTQKQYCNTRTEICCRIEVSTLAGAGSLQGSLGVGSGTYSGSNSQGGLFVSQAGQSSQSGFSQSGQSSQSGQRGQAGFNQVNQNGQGQFGAGQNQAGFQAGSTGFGFNKATSSSFGSQGTFGSQGSFGSQGNFGAGANNFGSDVNRGVVQESSSSSFEATRGNKYGGFGSTGAPTTNQFNGNTGFSNGVYKATSQSNFVETDSFSAGSENAGAYRPGSGPGLKPGIPYLPPVDSSTSSTNQVSSTAFVTQRPFSTPRPTRPVTKPTFVPSTSAPGYLPPQEGESSNNRETRLPSPSPTYSDGSLILDETRTTFRPPTFISPGPSPSDIPAGCAAALKCTPIEYCTAEGVMSNSTIILTRDQEAYRVPLTDCRDLETGRIGKCCRDPNYSDPWPTNQLGKWVPGVFGGNDGKYAPDSRGSSNNVRPPVTLRPPVTGSVLLNNFIQPKPTTSAYTPNSITPRFPTSTPIYAGAKGQYDVRGQGQYSVGGQGQYTTGGQGQYTTGGQGQYTTGGRGQIGVLGQGQGTQQTQGSQFTQTTSSFGQATKGGQGQFVSQGAGLGVTQGVGIGVSQGQGSFVQGGRGQYDNVGQAGQNQYTQTQNVIRGQGQTVTQGVGQTVKQGVGQTIRQGSGQTVRQGVGQTFSQGGGVGVITGSGQTVTGGQGFAVTQQKGQGFQTGQGQSVSQGTGQGIGFGIQGTGFNTIQGQGQYETQGQGFGISQGSGQRVNQGSGQRVSQGGGFEITQGGGQTVTQGTKFGVIRGQGEEASQGIGFGVNLGQGQVGFGLTQGGGQLVSQGSGQRVNQGTGFGITTGQGQGVTQGFGFGFNQGVGLGAIGGTGQKLTQGVGSGEIRGEGFSVSQGNGFGVENDYSESVQRVFLQQYSASGRCGLLNPQKPSGNRNDLEVDFAEIPWQAMVLLQTNKSLLCGGVITRPDVVITSAACVDGLDAKNVLIKGGEWKLGIDDEPLPFQIVQVKTILRHPFYRKGSLKYDAAILVLSENLRLEKNIYPICLPGSKDTLDAFYNGAGECLVTGWGKIVLQAHLKGSIMHSLNVSLINPGECEAKLTQDYPHLLEQYDQDSCACGQPTNPINNMCKVDIGSALACTTGDGHYVMRGIYSWDSGCQAGNQVAGFYKFDLEWYEWAIGLIESVRFAQFATGTKITKNTFSSQINSGTKTAQIGIKGGISGVKNSQDLNQFGLGQFSQFGSSKYTEGSNGLNFGSNIKGPLTNTFSATYTEKKVFQSEPKIVTYTTKPEIVTFTTKPEYFTYTTKPKLITYTTKPEIVTFTTKPEIVTYTTKPEIVTYTTKPKIVSYTTKPQIIRYETSGSGTNLQYAAPDSHNPTFSDIVGHKHTSACKCLEGKK